MRVGQVFAHDGVSTGETLEAAHAKRARSYGKRTSGGWLLRRDATLFVYVGFRAARV